MPARMNSDVAHPPSMLVITLFGPMQVTIEGLPLPRLRSRKALALLALLALRQGRPVQRDWIAATLWPDAEQEQAFASLRKALSELRQALGEQAGCILAPNRRALCLEMDGVFVDATAFDAAIKRKTHPALERAVALYQGSLLEGSPEEWVPQERAAREQDFLQTLGTLADAALAAGDWEAAAAHSRRALAADPWKEDARRALMQALAERGDSNQALQVYREFIDLLRDDPKAVPDSRTTALYTRLRAEAKRQAAQPQAVPVAMPPVPVVSGRLAYPLTELIGREDERVEVRMRLRRTRLVTLTGPGGIGKTRLSVAVASESARDFADGVCLVALETLSEGGRIARQIAGALGLKEEPGRDALTAVTEHLRAKRLLLVLDNCEQVLSASARVAGHLLGECAGVRVLATSREALGIAGETVWSVPPLSVPVPEHLPAGKTTLVRVMQSYEGVRLFVERAQSVHQEFTLTAANAASVAQVCSQMDGIPLAIELAAARVRVLTAEQIAMRLTDHLALLTGGSRVAQHRQQTLRATLDWSYALLTETERVLLGRLSVFAGGWDLEAAERVCSGGDIAAGGVLDGLTSLVDKSLVVFASPDPDDAGEEHASIARYRLLETVRQYASERLTASGEARGIKARHSTYFASLAESAEPNYGGPDQPGWLSRLESDHDNLRLALAWAEAGAEPEGGTVETTVENGEAWLRLCVSLRWFWDVRGHFAEGRSWLGRALTRTEEGPSTLLRARALHAAGVMALRQSDYAAARTLLEEALAAGRQQGHMPGVATALCNLGILAFYRGDHPEAQALLEESLALSRQSGDRRNITWQLSYLGIIHSRQGDNQAARNLHEECLQRSRQVGDLIGVAWQMGYLGNLFYDAGDFGAARALFDEGLVTARQGGNQLCIASALRNLGTLLLEEGDFEEARTLYEESLGISRLVGNEVDAAWSLRHLGRLAHEEKKFEAARSFYEESLSIARRGESHPDIAWSLEGLAALAASAGESLRGAVVWGAAEALRERIGLLLPPRERHRQAKQIELARALAGETAFTAAWNEGRLLTWEDAVAKALQRP